MSLPRLREELTLRVECYAVYCGEEEPCAFCIGSRRVAVVEVLDRWSAPDHRYFKVTAKDDALCILRHDTQADRWELTFFERGSQPK